MKHISETRTFGGRQLTLEHDSAATGTLMRVAVFLPPQESQRALSQTLV